jgi:conjugative relaxase-like TrwC/TraI family protein
LLDQTGARAVDGTLFGVGGKIVLRVSTLYASTAGTTAAYYAGYLTANEAEPVGVWLGQQARALGLTRDVTVDQLTALLSGRDPISGTPLGTPLGDRRLGDGGVVRAVAGFDATFSAPKSLSVLWALSGDDRFSACHDVAVAAAADYLERIGATTRIRSNGSRLHPDTLGLTMAAFRQSTSRADDPQLHTHLVVSAKVQTIDGHWRALDARILKRHQRALGGLYQSVLRAEVTARFGLEWGPIINGQAELVAVPQDLLAVFSKRASQVGTALDAKTAEFQDREGRAPSRYERAAMQREAAADTRTKKTGHGLGDLRDRWIAEAEAVGVTPATLGSWIREQAREYLRELGRDGASDTSPSSRMVQRQISSGFPSAEEVLDALAERTSTWHRLDVLRTVCDLSPPQPGMSGREWIRELDRQVDVIIADCIGLEPDVLGGRRGSDGRSVWAEPVANHYTSARVLAEEAAILEYAQHSTTPVRPSNTVDVDDLDVMQARAASLAAGHNPLVVIIGPAGTGKTTTLTAAIPDLHAHGRSVVGIAPTGKAAHVLGRETGIGSDTVAHFLHSHTPGRQQARRSSSTKPG